MANSTPVTALFPTAYLPSVYYMACLSQYESIAIETKETFPKQTHRNRAVIATGNGLQVLSVPVVRPRGNHTRTEEIGISYQEPWHIRHWRAIVSAYSAAPYFLYYRDGIEKNLLQPYERLVDLNNTMLAHLLKKLKINCEIAYTEDYTPATNNNLSALHDFRTTLCAKHAQPSVTFPPYSQVFDTRYGFLPNLSILDLLFNLGPQSLQYLKGLCSSTPQ